MSKHNRPTPVPPVRDSRSPIMPAPPTSTAPPPERESTLSSMPPGDTFQINEALFLALKAIAQGHEKEARTILRLPTDVDWSDVDAAERDIQAARALLDVAEQQRTMALLQIAGIAGPGTWLERNGEQVRIVTRGAKTHLRRKFSV